MSRCARALFHSCLPLLLVGIIDLGLCVPSACSADGPPPVAVGDPNFLIILDSSASMRRNDPDSLRTLAAQIVLALAGPRENIAIVTFSSSAGVLVPLQSVHDPQSRRNIRADVEKLRAGGFTNYSAALKLGADLLTQNPAPPAILIFLSDGRNNRGGSRVDVLSLLQERSLDTLHTIAFKDTADTGLLRDMAVATGGTHSLARTPLELLERFQSVARDFWSYVWIEGRDTASIFPGARKIAFVAERARGERAILHVTLNDQPLPPDLVDRIYAYPPPDSSRKRPIEIWTLDDPPLGRYTARLAAGARILAVLERLPFTVNFVTDKPKSLYQQAKDDTIEIAVRVAAPNPDLVAALHRSVAAFVAFTGSSEDPLPSQPVIPDPAGGASFLLTAVSKTIDFPSTQREKALDVVVTLRLNDPNTPSDPQTIWTKELRKTIVLKRLQKGLVTIGMPDVKRPPLKAYPLVLDFGTVNPPETPSAIMLELTNTTDETIDLVFESVATPVAGVPDAPAIRISRPDLAEKEIDMLTIPPHRTRLVRVGMSLPQDLPDGDYDAALLLSWTAPDKLDMILEVPIRLSVRRPD